MCTDKYAMVQAPRSGAATCERRGMLEGHLGKDLKIRILGGTFQSSLVGKISHKRETKEHITQHDNTLFVANALAKPGTKGDSAELAEFIANEYETNLNVNMLESTENRCQNNWRSQSKNIFEVQVRLMWQKGSNMKKGVGICRGPGCVTSEEKSSR